MYELAEQLGWRWPDVVLFPTGGGISIVAFAKWCPAGAYGSKINAFADALATSVVELPSRDEEITTRLTIDTTGVGRNGRGDSAPQAARSAVAELAFGGRNRVFRPNVEGEPGLRRVVVDRVHDGFERFGHANHRSQSCADHDAIVEFAL